jgi:excisionase family DNA binding protein
MNHIPHTSPPDENPFAGQVNGRGYYNISQAAALLGVSRVSIWRWIRAGRLPASRLGHRTTRIRSDDLDRLLVQIQPREGHDEQAGAIGAGGAAPRASEHVVRFYEADEIILDEVAAFIGTTLRSDASGVVLATEAHRTGIEQRLRATGIDIDAAASQGRFISLDAAETLARIMLDRTPDPACFREIIGGVLQRAGVGRRRLHVFGELVALLVDEGNAAAAVRLEEMWNELQQTEEFSLFCAYPLKQFAEEAAASRVDDIFHEHGRVLPAESFVGLQSDDDRLRAITLLQHKARWLEAEIAERRRAEERLRAALAAEQAARESAEAAWRVRDEFISIAAHELKTPLTTLYGQAQLALRQLSRAGHLEPALLERALQAISGQAGKLARLLSQLLDVSRMDAGQLPLERQQIDLTVLVEQVAAGIRARGDDHAISLVAPASLDAFVDPLRLEQVLTNLLDNAIKYSPDGGPIEVVLGGDGSTTAQITVRDHGLGIPPEKRGQIFERFYQAHANGYRSGVGLGLYISRQIVELHDGEIRADFPDDGGTRFTVRIPTQAREPVADDQT